MWGQCHQSGLPDLREAAAACGGTGVMLLGESGLSGSHGAGGRGI